MMVKKSGLCFISCCQEMPIIPFLFTENKFSLLFVHLQYQNDIFKSIFKCFKKKKIFKIFFNTYSNPVFQREVKTQASLCFKVPQTEKDLKHTYTEVWSDFVSETTRLLRFSRLNPSTLKVKWLAKFTHDWNVKIRSGNLGNRIFFTCTFCLGATPDMELLLK